MAIIKVRDKDGNYIDIPALNGESAYNIAVKNGYTGTEAEWLESLKGTDGVSPSIRTIEAPKGYVLEIIDANGKNYISLLHGKDGTSPTVSVTETDTGHDVDITDSNGSHTFSVANGLDGNGKITVKSKTYAMDWSDGEVIATTSEKGIAFYLKETLPENARVIDFSINYNPMSDGIEEWNEYYSSDLLVNNILLTTDIINIYSIIPYKSSRDEYMPIFISGTRSTLFTRLAASDVPESIVSSLTLYYVEVM